MTGIPARAARGNDAIQRALASWLNRVVGTSIARGLLGLYRALAYVAFLASFALLVLAATGMNRVPAIDRPATLPAPAAFAIDVGLMLLFAVQHTVMARAPFKRALARILPPAAERSTYVLASSVCIAAIALGWSPIDGDLWALSGPAAALATAIALGGFVFSGMTTFAFDHLVLFGLREPRGELRFRVPLFYRWVRHPMMLGLLVGIWSAPRMTVGHLVFAATMTAYVLVGVRYEERELLRVFGDEYARYRATVPSLLPWPRPRGAATSSSR